MPRRIDQYETPPHYVEPLLELIGSLDGRTVYEPCVGKWHIARHLLYAKQLLTNDLDPACAADTHLDAALGAAWVDAEVQQERWFDWTITNPPFEHELAILQHAIAHSANVAFLARISFLEPTRTRQDFWAAHPPTDVIVLPRYSFRLNDFGKRQTDNVTCCWIVFRQGRPACLRFSSRRSASTMTARSVASESLTIPSGLSH